jgi:hypothetical protein
MSEIVTPDQIIQALSEVRREAEKGIQAQYEAEIELAEKIAAADKLESGVYLRIQGLVADRQALAKLEATDARFEVDLAKAKYNRVKTKLQMLQQQQSALQTQARMVEITYLNSHR